MSLKNTFFALPLVFMFILTGCDDKAQNKKEEVIPVATAKVPSIEVVQNTNSHEIKVEEKEKTELKTQDGKAYYYDYNVKSEYDPHSQPANKDRSIRVKPRTVLDANMHIRSPYEKVQVSLIAKKLSRTFKLKCSACHDDYANGLIGPSLRKKDADFIYGKIMDFKTGKASNPLMTDLIKRMENEEIRKIAEEIYEFNKKVEELRNK